MCLVFLLGLLALVLQQVMTIPKSSAAHTSAHPDGTLVRVSGNPTVYLIESSQRRGIISGAAFVSQGYDWGRVKVATTSDAALAVGTNVGFREGTLAQGTGPVYAIDDASGTLSKRQIVNFQSFAALGYQASEVLRVTDAELPSPTGGAINDASAHPDGTLIRATGQPTVFLIENGQRRGIISGAAFSSQGYDWNRIKIATTADNALPTSSTIGLREGALAQGTGPVYVIDDTAGTFSKRQIVTYPTFVALGYQVSELLRVSDAELPATPGANVPNDQPTTVTVAAGGDIACDPSDPEYNGGDGTATRCRMKTTSDLLVAQAFDAVLALGDLQYPNGTLTTFQQGYDPTWGLVKNKTYPAPGNHDYHTAGAAGYYTYFGAAAGDPAKGYYSFDLGNWHVISLNSNCANVGGCGAGSAQEVWLRNDLATHANTCTVAYWHHARFSSGSHGNQTELAALWQALYDGNADLILSGHDHNYERFAPQNPSAQADAVRGIRQFVVGTGGYSHYTTPNIQPNSEVRDSSSFGVLKLTLNATGYDWQFLPIAGQSFTDAGSGTCH